jgi:hypothetical protein
VFISMPSVQIIALHVVTLPGSLRTSLSVLTPHSTPRKTKTTIRHVFHLNIRPITMQNTGRLKHRSWMPNVKRKSRRNNQPKSYACQLLTSNIIQELILTRPLTQCTTPHYALTSPSPPNTHDSTHQSYNNTPQETTQSPDIKTPQTP